MIRYAVLLALPILAACSSGSGCNGTQSTNGQQGNGGGGLGPVLDANWKTDIPNELSSMSSTETVKVVMQFATAFTSADSSEIVSTGGTVLGTDFGGSTNDVQAQYTVSDLINLAKTYAGSAIQAMTAEVNGQLSGSPTGC